MDQLNKAKQVNKVLKESPKKKVLQNLAHTHKSRSSNKDAGVKINKIRQNQTG